MERRRRLAAISTLLLAAAALAPLSACRSVDKGGGVFCARATGVNFLGFTIPDADFDVARRLVDEEVGDTARITNVRSTNTVPPWTNVFLQILGWETWEICGTY